VTSTVGGLVFSPKAPASTTTTTTTTPPAAATAAPKQRPGSLPRPFALSQLRLRHIPSASLAGAALGSVMSLSLFALGEALRTGDDATARKDLSDTDKLREYRAWKGVALTGMLFAATREVGDILNLKPKSKQILSQFPTPTQTPYPIQIPTPNPNPNPNPIPISMFERKVVISTGLSDSSAAAAMRSSADIVEELAKRLPLSTAKGAFVATGLFGCLLPGLYLMRRRSEASD
jgi:hypothetical protein